MPKFRVKITGYYPEPKTIEVEAKDVASAISQAKVETGRANVVDDYQMIEFEVEEDFI